MNNTIRLLHRILPFVIVFFGLGCVPQMSSIEDEYTVFLVEGIEHRILYEPEIVAHHVLEGVSRAILGEHLIRDSELAFDWKLERRQQELQVEVLVPAGVWSHSVWDTVFQSHLRLLHEQLPAESVALHLVSQGLLGVRTKEIELVARKSFEDTLQEIKDNGRHLQ